MIRQFTRRAPVTGARGKGPIVAAAIIGLAMIGSAIAVAPHLTNRTQLETTAQTSSTLAGTKSATSSQPGTCAGSPVNHSGNPCELSAAAQQQKSYNAWCPTAESTHPTCSLTGAFQEYNPEGPPVPGDPANDQNLLRWANTIQAGMEAAEWPTAARFFQHYLDATGSDIRYDAGDAYANDNNFSTTVDATVKRQISTAHTAGSTFDSGWHSYTFPNHLSDWYNAVGHGFYRVTGQRDGDGTWSVHLQLTSYYQFRETQQFKLVDGVAVNGKDMVRLAQVGKAKNFRTIGDRDLAYDANGNLSTHIFTYSEASKGN